MRTRLAADGYDVVTAADGAEALAAARDSSPDLILLDIMMPKVDGVEVCRRLKKQQGASFMPVILVTAMTDAKDIVAGLEAGADEYLTKPVDHAALSARVRSMLRIKALHDTVATQAEEIARWNATLERRAAGPGGRAGQGGPSRRSPRTRFPPAAPPIRSSPTAGRSAWSSSISAASPPSPRWPSPRRCRRSSAPTTPRSDISSSSTRARSSASPATA